MEKHSESRRSYLFAHLHLLSSDSFSSHLLSSDLFSSDSSHLCFSTVHIVGSFTSKLPSIMFSGNVYVYNCIYIYIYIYAEWQKHMVHCLQWFLEFQCKCQFKRIGAMFPGNVPCNDPLVAAVLPLRWHKHCWRAACRASRPIFQVMQSFDQVSSILDVLEECHSYSSD